ncbi:hypothetical protein SFMTTN_2964 [Sulfuriferula multivorans]|uniref:Uncharacterized protein n=1 Tax=Sulfuriferula multivorans TaxID=1559896 RepID=A0A401K0I5_9PROT|nr:hypothetical protein SFMTTN_2964 [Sulfuriferula multivorans]
MQSITRPIGRVRIETGYLMCARMVPKRHHPANWPGAD